MPSDSFEGLATYDLLSVQRRLKARSRMESRTIVCYLGEVPGVKSINLSWSGVTDERATVKSQQLRSFDLG